MTVLQPKDVLCLFHVVGNIGRRIFFEEPKKTQAHGTILTYDGVPFVVRGTIIMECQHGRKRNPKKGERQQVSLS